MTSVWHHFENSNHNTRVVSQNWKRQRDLSQSIALTNIIIMIVLWRQQWQQPWFSVISTLLVERVENSNYYINHPSKFLQIVRNSHFRHVHMYNDKCSQRMSNKQGEGFTSIEFTGDRDKFSSFYWLNYMFFWLNLHSNLSNLNQSRQHGGFIGIHCSWVFISLFITNFAQDFRILKIQISNRKQLNQCMNLWVHI